MAHNFDQTPHVHEASKMEHHCPTALNVQYRESQHYSPFIHVPTFWDSLLSTFPPRVPLEDSFNRVPRRVSEMGMMSLRSNIEPRPTRV